MVKVCLFIILALLKFEPLEITFFWPIFCIFLPHPPIFSLFDNFLRIMLTHKKNSRRFKCQNSQSLTKSEGQRKKLRLMEAPTFDQEVLLQLLNPPEVKIIKNRTRYDWWPPLLVKLFGHSRSKQRYHFLVREWFPQPGSHGIITPQPVDGFR